MYNFIFFIVASSCIYLGAEVYYDEILLRIGIRDSLEPWNAYIHLQTEWGNGRYHWWGTPWYSDLVTQEELMFKIFRGEIPQRFAEIFFVFSSPEVKIMPLEVFSFPQQENYVWVTGYLLSMEHYIVTCEAFPNDPESSLDKVFNIYSLIKSGSSPLEREKILISLLRDEKESFFFVEKILDYSPKKFVTWLEGWVNFNYENLKNTPEFKDYFTDEKAPEWKLKELINFYNKIKNRI